MKKSLTNTLQLLRIFEACILMHEIFKSSDDPICINYDRNNMTV